MAEHGTDDRQESRAGRLVDWILTVNTVDPLRMRQGRLAALVALAFELLTLIALGVTIYLRASGSPAESPFLGSGRIALLATVWMIIYLVNRGGATVLAGVAVSLVTLLLDVALLSQSGPLTANVVALVVPIILAGLFGPPVAALVFAVVTAGAYLLVNLSANPAYLASDALAETGLVYANLAFVAVLSWLLARTTKQAVEESEERGLALVLQRSELQAQIMGQSQRLQATMAVARAIAGARDLDALLDDIVRLMRETFQYYHVQVFLVDETHHYAVLHKSTGRVGQQLLAQGHRLPVGSLSVIGQVTAGGQPVIARDTDTDTVHRRNELLPDTRSEMAIPLSVGHEVIGALDLQSLESDAFAPDEIPTLRALADQLAVAIQNARLFEQAEDSLRELRELGQEVTQQSWVEFLTDVREMGRRQVFGPEPDLIRVHRDEVIRQIMVSGGVLFSDGFDGRQCFLAAPIVVRDQIVGVIGVEPSERHEWTQNDIRLIQAVAERAALAVENARLYVQSRRTVERERMVGDMVIKMQHAPNLNLLLQSVTAELARALGTDNVYAELSVEATPADQRRQVSEVEQPPDDSTSEIAAGEREEGPATTDDGPVPPDEPEEARAEL
jgi:GAF domain-containing protein